MCIWNLRHLSQRLSPPSGLMDSGADRAPVRGVAAPEKISAPEALHSLVTENVLMLLIAVGTAVAAVVIAVVILRNHIIKKSLKSRVCYELLPSSAFDASQEEIQRFAFQLTRTRPAESGLRPRRAASVRIKMGTDINGKLGYSISGPSRASSVLRHPTYRQVETREISTEVGSPPESFDHPGHRP